jgi:acyl carrier protein
MERILNNVKNTVAEISFCEKDDVVPEASFTNDHEIGFDFPLLIGKIEEEFNIDKPRENY